MQANKQTTLLLISLALVSLASCYPNQINRRSANNGQDAPIVMGKFRAPAPERILRTRIPKNSNFGSQTMSASYRVADVNQDNQPEKIVHGITGASIPQRTVERTVGARIQVSDEGLNYPPSKLSADIYGNVAEIVTAPPEAVEQDLLVPQVSKLFGTRRGN